MTITTTLSTTPCPRLLARRRAHPAGWLAAALALAIVATFLFSVPTTCQGADRSLERVNGTAGARQRLALVIGNGAYADSPLRNPVNDARSMASALERFGFKVRLLVDADQRKIENAIRVFTNDLRDQRGIGLFYFAGHGMQIEGHNYLIPIGANIAAEHEVRYESVDVGRLMDGLVGAGSANVVILDACRNNPFARSFRSSRQGLAQMDAPTNTLIAYATAPGLVAADGDGANGLYTEQLLGAMDTPGVPIEQVFKQVRREVERHSDGRQTPWESSSLKVDIVLRPASSPLPEPPRADDAKPGEIAGGYDQRLDIAAWNGIAESCNRLMYNQYLDQFPDGQYRGYASIQLGDLDLWERTKAADSQQAYADYLDRFPKGCHAADARARATLHQESRTQASNESQYTQSGDGGTSVGRRETLPAAPVTIYSDDTRKHLGDENIKGWPGLHGRCLDVPFSASGAERTLRLNVETYGAESVSILLNGIRVGRIPTQTPIGNKRRPNYWSRPVTVDLSGTYLARGYNQLQICGEAVSNPEYAGDLDDLQIRRLRLQLVGR